MTSVQRRSYLSLFASAVILVAAGCGGSASTTGPEPASAPTSSGTGATITGTVQTGAQAFGVAASAMSGLRVSVVGTSLAATTDSAGRFNLPGVSAGNAQLQFEGTGVDARLAVNGLVAGHTRTITVKVSGNSASCVNSSDEDGSVHFEGAISSLSPLMIGNRTVTTDASTVYLDASGAASTASAVLVVGNDVTVEGQPQSGGTVLATRIRIDEKEPSPEPSPRPSPMPHVSFRGTIASLSPLVIGGKTVMTDASTQYLSAENLPATASQLLVTGNTVEVKGTLQTGGVVLATTIKATEGREVHVEGTISSLSPLSVGSWTVMTDANTRYLDGRGQSVTAGQVLVVGNKVELQGPQQSAGVVLAESIRLETSGDHGGH